MHYFHLFFVLKDKDIAFIHLGKDTELPYPMNSLS